jgi:hypothetical protein
MRPSLRAHIYRQGSGILLLQEQDGTQSACSRSQPRMHTASHHSKQQRLQAAYYSSNNPMLTDPAMV